MGLSAMAAGSPESGGKVRAFKGERGSHSRLKRLGDPSQVQERQQGGGYGADAEYDHRHVALRLAGLQHQPEAGRESRRGQQPQRHGARRMAPEEGKLLAAGGLAPGVAGG